MFISVSSEMHISGMALVDQTGVSTLSKVHDQMQTPLSRRLMITNWAFQRGENPTNQGALEGICNVLPVRYCKITSTTLLNSRRRGRSTALSPSRIPPVRLVDGSPSLVSLWPKTQSTYPSRTADKKTGSAAGTAHHTWECGFAHGIFVSLSETDSR
jgi:hypothetical protein